MAFAPKLDLVGVPSAWRIDAVDADLVGGVAADESRRRSGHSTAGDGLESALAEVALLVAITEFERFVFTSAGTAWHRSTAHRAAFEYTSTSTVGLPRESMTSRPTTFAIVRSSIRFNFG